MLQKWDIFRSMEMCQEKTFWEMVDCWIIFKRFCFWMWHSKFDQISKITSTTKFNISKNSDVTFYFNVKISVIFDLRSTKVGNFDKKSLDPSPSLKVLSICVFGMVLFLLLFSINSSQRGGRLRLCNIVGYMCCRFS